MQKLVDALPVPYYIAMLASPWIPVPPNGYGGTEQVIALLGPIQPGQESYFEREIEPHLDDDRVRYLGEVGGAEKQKLFANARTLLMPIRWNEPFGLVMVEALACGTPVIAFRQGAAPATVHHGVNGYLVADEQAMAAAIADLHKIDPAACRQ